MLFVEEKVVTEIVTDSDICCWKSSQCLEKIELSSDLFQNIAKSQENSVFHFYYYKDIVFFMNSLII